MTKPWLLVVQKTVNRTVKKTLAKIMDQGAKFLCVDSSIFMEMYILRKSISWAYFLDNEFVIHRPPHQLVIYE